MSAWFNKFLAVVTVSAGVNVAAQAQSNENILPTLPGWENIEVVDGARQESRNQAAQQRQQPVNQQKGQKTVVLVPCKDANGELVFKMKEVDPSTIQEVQNVSSQTGVKANKSAKKQQAYTDIYNYDGGKGNGISVAHEDGSRTTIETSHGKISATRNPAQGGYIKINSDGTYSYDVGAANGSKKKGVVTASKNVSGNRIIGINTGENGQGRVTVLTSDGGVTIRSYTPETGTSEVTIGKQGIKTSGRTRIAGDIFKSLFGRGR